MSELLEKVDSLLYYYSHVKNAVEGDGKKLLNMILDEAKEAYEHEANMQGLPYGAFDAIGKAIDNLRGNDESIKN